MRRTTFAVWCSRWSSDHCHQHWIIPSMFTFLSCLSLDYTATLHRFTQLKLFSLLKTTLQVEWCSTGTQTRRCGMNITNYLDKYQYKSLSTSTKTRTLTSMMSTEYILLPLPQVQPIATSTPLQVRCLHTASTPSPRSPHEASIPMHAATASKHDIFILRKNALFLRKVKHPT